MTEHVVGRISFDNTRAGNAIRVLKDEIIDRHMWEEEFCKKDEECEALKKTLEEWREQAMKYQEIIRDLQRRIRRKHGCKK